MILLNRSFVDLGVVYGYVWVLVGHLHEARNCVNQTHYKQDEQVGT